MSDYRILGMVPVGAGIAVDYNLWWYQEDAASYLPQAVVGLAVVEEHAPNGRCIIRLRPVVSNKGLLDESDPEFVGFTYSGPEDHPVPIAQHTAGYMDAYLALMGELPDALP